ncbi:uncharacterized protein LOC122854774 isoform X2 [Aphidius gifuensis]|uniref:uncharacterized protein LOC122854774 isoform X2 n=1 Tax=Aphidius gifuensis TaxID=684658 RepID=UPI001CDD1211|nr:uncharacterized protein LOC122854774 isoform X2 [Aphidius gifuensis]
MALDNPSYFTLSGGTVPPSGLSNDKSTLSKNNNTNIINTGSLSRGFAALFLKKSIMNNNNNKILITSENKSDNLVENKFHNNEPKRNLRSLFRSISANADNETLQILKGEPRPSDVAPPSPYLPHRSHSHSDHDRRRPNRRKILKSASELLSNDMIFCGLPGEEEASSRLHDNNNNNNHNNDDEEQDTGEVFLGIDDARYYNLSATLPAPGPSGSRRHSIGTFRDKEQNLAFRRKRIIQTEGFIKEPDGFAPPIPTDQVDGIIHDNTVHERKHKCVSRKGLRTRGITAKPDGTNMIEDRDDVVFISSKVSEASTLWVNYLTACFEQISRQQGRPPFKVRHVTVEDSTSPIINERILKSRLQIIIVCPVLLECATRRSEQASSLAKQLSPNRVLAMMLGVHDGHLNDNQKSVFITYDKWRKFFVKDQDETFVGEFLGAAVSILGTTTSSSLKNDKTTFTVHPKKVKIGNNRVIVIMNDPLKPEDMVSVIVDRCGEVIDISQVKKRNPYTLQFAIPDRCLEVSMLIGVRIIVNGIGQGVRQVKCESRLRELDQILRANDNPFEFMCQTFGFHSGDREQFDNWIVHSFQKNLPPKFDLLSTPNGTVPLQKNTTSSDEYPTLLHFAARFGLEKLAWQLLECPGGDIACDIKNVAELTPADIAENSGHTKLAHQLRGYMQMNEFTNMYSYLKVISENSNIESNNESSPPVINSNSQAETEVDREDYCQPRPISEAYLVPPAARPITSPITASSSNLSSSSMCSNNFMGDMNYSIVPPPTPVLSSSVCTPINLDANCLNSPLQGPKIPVVTAPLMALKNSRKDLSMSRDDNSMTNSRNTNSSNSSSSQGRKSRELSGPQDELLEIINDFKNNVFTISEVERLVETWKNRNDVQQNFKDKQRQLTTMRDEYDRIQKKMKDEMKTTTPFDRIKKFFSKGKKDSSKDSSNNEENDGASIASEATDKTPSGGSDRRPISSLSLHSVSSSSSSGRMSIISGCSGTSLGDSGTHSDTEDRRLRNSREDKNAMMNYEIPPAPKPFTGKYSPMRHAPPSTTRSFDTDNNNRRVNVQNDDFYIAFPVSGLPIHSYNPDGSIIEPKTPFTPCDTSPQFLMSNKILEEEVASSGEIINNSSLEYINVTASTLIDEKKNDTENLKIDKNSSNVVETVSEKEKQFTKDIADEEVNTIEDKILTLSETTTQVSCLQSKHVSNSMGLDVVDAPMPDYMNIQPIEQEPKVVGTIPKKIPPQVPPRASTKK